MQELAGAAIGAKAVIEQPLALVDERPLPGAKLDPTLAVHTDLLRTLDRFDRQRRPP